MLDIVELSRLQFALTAMYHFLFCATDARYGVPAGHYGNGLRPLRQTDL